jgi:hypothetical protein
MEYKRKVRRKKGRGKLAVSNVEVRRGAWISCGDFIRNKNIIAREQSERNNLLVNYEIASSLPFSSQHLHRHASAGVTWTYGKYCFKIIAASVFPKSRALMK